MKQQIVFLVLLAWGLQLTACTTTRVVTDSREELIPESTATHIRPVIDILRRPVDTPELVVRVARHIEGPVEIKEHKHDEVKKIWSPNPLTMLLGWFGVGAFPFYFVGHTLDGNPGTAFSALGSSTFMALGFNPPEGWELHERAERTDQRVTSTPGGTGTTQMAWAHAWLELNIAGLPPEHPAVDSTGQVTVDLRRYPINLYGRQEDLTIRMWTEIAGTIASEEITLSPSAIAVWEQEEDKRERLAQAQRAEKERAQQAEREREVAKLEYERLHPEIVAARKAQEEAARRKQLAEATLRRATERAERQYEQCTSPCTNQSLLCTASCLGDPKSYNRCSLSCSAATESCTSRCEQQKNAQIIAAGGETKENGGKAFLSGLVAASNAFATAMEGGRPSSANGPASLSPFSGTLGATSSHSSGGRCDDSSEVSEIEQLNQRVDTETRGMGIPRIQCYAAAKFVRIAELQLRAAKRCNIEISESEAELRRMQAQEQSLCKGIK